MAGFIYGGDSDWSTSGNDIFNSNSGNVGIGTDGPQRPLHVSGVGQFGDSTNPGDIKIYGSTGSTPSLTVGLTDAGAGQDWQIQNTASNFTLAMGSGLNPITVSNGDGYVGINESTPLYSLDIDASNGMRISYGASSGGGGLVYNVSNSSLSMITSENIDSSQTCGLNIKSSGKRILLTNSGVGGNEVLNRGTTDNSICLLSAGDIRFGNTTALNASTVPAMIVKSNAVGIGTEAPNAGAILELTSTTQALIIPRMTTLERNAISGENGMVVYNSTSQKMNIFANGSWEEVSSS